MLRKFIDWWNQKPNGDAIGVNQGLYLEEEYKYETTLARDLKLIASLLGKEFPKDMVTDFYTLKSEGKINFYTKGVTEKEIMNKVKLKSLKVERRWESIDTILWRASHEEYRKVYQSKHMRYANVVRELLRLVEKNLDNPEYSYTFCKYEDSIYIVASTLKDEYENNDDVISEEVFQKAKVIIEKCGQAIMKKYRELEHIEELQKEAVNKSLINRLDNEIEFIDKYIEVN